ncbi:hypothetical protein ElyMa_003931900 [Elysia marginata]|uniref:UBC core domain-containing protein n=1 Tax=Elysia marginata TaxID=1093978 RepID=A0AAV4FS60_9GAST|nr:hypothetical protein ElyMa_003931900 [Elysia marginata]
MYYKVSRKTPPLWNGGILCLHLHGQGYTSSRFPRVSQAVFIALLRAQSPRESALPSEAAQHSYNRKQREFFSLPHLYAPQGSAGRGETLFEHQFGRGGFETETDRHRQTVTETMAKRNGEEKADRAREKYW